MKLYVDADTREARRWFDGAAKRAGTPGPMLRMMSTSLQEAEQQLFRTRGNRKWSPDDPATVRAKNSRRVLVDTGDLMRDMTATPDMLSDAVEVRTDLPYAHWVKVGSQRRGMKGRNPAPRPTTSRLNKLAEALLRYLTGTGA